MQQEDAFKALAFELPLPRDDSCGQYRYSGERCDEEIAVSRCGQQVALGPSCKKIKHDVDDKERDREMNQHDVLRVLGEKYGLDVQRPQGLSSFTARRLCPSSSGESNRSMGMFLPC